MAQHAHRVTTKKGVRQPMTKEQLQWVLALRRSGAATRKTSGTRSTRKNAAIREY
jgi:hypothetical protein